MDMWVMERKVINQSAAARLRGVSRQRISELYAKGRFTVPKDADGRDMRGALYLDEVEAMGEVKSGRPKLSIDERKRRELDAFKVKDRVVWEHTPRDGYGFKTIIDAEVAKVGASRLLLSFVGGDGKPRTAWVNRKHCQRIEVGGKN